MLNLSSFRSKYSRSGTRRLGDEYQDLIALGQLVEWLEHSDRYQWIKLEANEMGYLDDIVALQSNNTVVVRQVKYSTNTEAPDDPWSWEKLLERSKTKRGDFTASLLQKWFSSFKKISEQQWKVVDAGVFSNRRASSEISLILKDGFLDFDKIQDTDLRSTIVDQLGDENDVIFFFKSFKFSFDQPGLEEVEESLRRRFDRLGGTENGWLNLRKELRGWVINQLEPAPDGKIKLIDIKKAGLWYSLQSLTQRFEIPPDYVLPSEDFHQQIINSLNNSSKSCCVVTASPGVGKSTYISYLYESLQKLEIPVIRHHYYLSFDDRNRIARLDHRRAAESLMFDLDRDYPEAVSTVGDRNPQVGDLYTWLEAAGNYYSKKGQSLVLLIDGLDHVWREQKSIKELDEFLNMFLPPPSGLIVLLATQPIDDNKLPRNLLRSAPRSDWFHLPLLNKSSVGTWLNYHINEIAENNGEPILDWKMVRMTDALYSKSKGHPLHLRYSLKSLLDRNKQVTEETISELPECAHEEIVRYYEDLWAILSEESREILHLITACPFPWPREGVFACLDPESQKLSSVRRSLSEVSHLLVDSELGLQVFHSSLLTFIENTTDHKDYAIYVKRKALVWLTDNAPDFWKWAYEWILQADLGDEDPLYSGPSRQWAIESLTKRYFIEDIDQIIEKSIKVALSRTELQRAVELGLLREYSDYAYDYQLEVLEIVLYSQLKLEEDPYLRQRLRSNLEKLSDKELAILASVEAKQSNLLFVKRIIDELVFRSKHPREDGRYSSWSEKLRPLLETFALIGSSESKKIVDWALRNRNNGLTLEMLAIYSKRLRALKQSEALRTLLNLSLHSDGKEETEKTLLDKEKEVILQEVILLALEENLDIDHELASSQTNNPLFAIYSYIKKFNYLEPWGYELPSPTVMFEKSYDIALRNSKISDRYRFVFHCFLADSLFEIQNRNINWLKEIGDYSWARLFVHELYRLAGKAAAYITAGRPIPVEWVYEQTMSYPRSKWPDNRDESEFSEASVITLQMIAYDLYIFSNTNGHPINISADAVKKVFNSSYCIRRQWVTTYLDQERNWMGEEAVKWIIESQNNEFKNTIEEFPTRAEGYAILANLSVSHGFIDETHDFIQKVGENLIAHFHHKDMIINESLDIIELCQPLYATHEQMVPYHFLLELAPAIAEIHSFTDGDETGHLPEALADTLMKVNATKLPEYYLWLCEIEEPDDALHALHTFLKKADLSDPIVRAIAETAIDYQSLRIFSEFTDGDDPYIKEISTLVFQVIGKYIEPESLSSSSNVSQNPSEFSEDPNPSFDEYPPENVIDFFSELNYRQIIHRDEKIFAWIEYWTSIGRKQDVYQAMGRIVEKGYYFHGYDKIFDLCLSLYGKDIAYPWLIMAQNKESGWYRYHTSEDEAQKRWEIVRELYPDKWFDFLQQTFATGSLTFVRLIEYLILFEQYGLAKLLLSTIISNTLDYTSPGVFPIPKWVTNEPKEICENLLYPMLFSRLNWPSLLVQERAATSIANLLLEKKYGASTLKFLMEWIEYQKLESVAIKGVLILMRARILDPNYQVPSLNEIKGIYSARSIVSWLLFSAYDSQNDEKLSQSLENSGEVPDDFSPDPFFEKYISGFLPPIYNYWASQIEEMEKFPFHKQWAFEWNAIVNKIQITPSCAAMNNYWGREHMGRRYTAVDTEMSEVYRSSYLRALAFALQNSYISQNNGTFLAAETCPLDLELWKLPPQKKPSWWPIEIAVTQQTDTAIGKIWKQVESLWEAQLNSQEQDWILGEATGFIQQDETIYDLEIYGVFTKCHGRGDPEIEKIIDFIRGEDQYDGENNNVSFILYHPLFFKGEIQTQSINNLVRRFDDWTILPACGYVHPTTTPRWQTWRMYRQLWLPAPCLGNQRLTFSVESESLVIKDTNRIIGKWNDWTDGLSEMVIHDVPIRSGQYLLLSKEKIREFSQLTNSNFCWFCRLNVYYKESSYGDYKLLKNYQTFGNFK